MKVVQLIALLAIAGCAGVAPPSGPQILTSPVVTTEQVVERSYTVGAEQAVFVGGTMARVRDYMVEKTTRQGALHASQDFSLFYPILGPRIFVKTTDVILIAGTTVRDGVPYRLVTFPQIPLVKLLITDDGRFEGSGLGLGDSRMGYNYTPDPPSVRLRSDTSTSAISAKGYLNFELVYSGVTKDSIGLHYREYTQQDLVRPAFSQDLVYERDANTIRFRNIQLRVIEATGERLRFVVLEDGYPSQKK